MPNISQQNSLTSIAEKMRAKTRMEQECMEKLVEKEYELLQKNLLKSSKSAVDTTEAAILKSMDAMEKKITTRCDNLGSTFSRPFRQAMLWSLGLMIFTSALLCGVIFLSRYRIQDLQAEIEKLQSHKTKLEQTVGSWPIDLHADESGRFVVPKKSHTLKDGWTLNGQPIWKVE